MTAVHVKTKAHPGTSQLAGYLSNSLSAKEMSSVEEHLASCRECLEKTLSAYDAVRDHNAHAKPNKKRSPIMKNISLPLVLAIISFTLSFVIPQYFIQLLVATLILGIKWVVDSKSAKMLVMIYEAWKTGGEREASRILETLESKYKPRF